MPIRLTSPPRSLQIETALLPVQKKRLHEFKAWSSAGKLLICTLVAGAISLIFSWSTLWGSPQSAFFNPDSAYEYRYTNHRLQESKAYISVANASDNVPTGGKTTTNQPVLCASMVTVKRKKDQYVSDAIGSMLAGLTPEERSAVDARLLFANLNPTVHPDWNSTWLNTLDWWGAYNITETEREMLHDFKAEGNIYAKGLFDYTYGLEQCYNGTGAPYIALLEDDIIFADGWLAKTLDALASVRLETDAWLYLRLFFTEWQLGWDKDVDSMATNPVLWLVMPVVSCLVLAAAVAVRCRKMNRDVDHTHCASLWVLFCVTIPMIFALVFVIRPDGSMLPDGVQRMDTKGCCAQALIYPREQVPALVAHIRDLMRGPTDLVIEKYANEAGLARYAVSPQLVQHVGLVSTRGMPKKWTQQTWAFSFEAQKARKLKLEHERLARWGIWRSESYEQIQ